MLSLYQHRHNGRIPPSAQDIAIVAVTEGIIHTLIEKVGGEAFVRLSSRSPKDACGVDKDLFVKQLAKQRKLAAIRRAKQRRLAALRLARQKRLEAAR